MGAAKYEYSNFDIRDIYSSVLTKVYPQIPILTKDWPAFSFMFNVLTLYPKQLKMTKKEFQNYYNNIEYPTLKELMCTYTSISSRIEEDIQDDNGECVGSRKVGDLRYLALSIKAPLSSGRCYFILGCCYDRIDDDDRDRVLFKHPKLDYSGLDCYMFGVGDVIQDYDLDSRVKRTRVTKRDIMFFGHDTEKSLVDRGYKNVWY